MSSINILVLLAVGLVALPTGAASAAAPLGPPPSVLDPKPSAIISAAARPGPARCNRIIIAYALLGAAAFLALIPAAVLAGRWLRRFGWWLRVHQLLNGAAGAAVVASFGLGHYHVGHDRGGGLHQR